MYRSGCETGSTSLRLKVCEAPSARVRGAPASGLGATVSGLGGGVGCSVCGATSRLADSLGASPSTACCFPFLWLRLGRLSTTSLTRCRNAAAFGPPSHPTSLALDLPKTKRGVHFIEKDRYQDFPRTTLFRLLAHPVRLDAFLRPGDNHAVRAWCKAAPITWRQVLLAGISRSQNTDPPCPSSASASRCARSRSARA